MSKIEKAPTGPFNPFYGCAIFIIIVLFGIGIVSWVVYSGYAQDRAIAQMTVDEVSTLPVPEVTAEQKTALQARLTTFHAEAVAGKDASLALTVEDLNHLLVVSGESDIADYRGIVKFTGLDAASQTVLADLCWPMNRFSLTDKSKRYLVGQAGFKPTIDNNSLDMSIDTLTVPGKIVNPGFLGSLQGWPWLNLAKVNATVSATLEKVTSYQIATDNSVITLRTGKAKEAGQ